MTKIAPAPRRYPESGQICDSRPLPEPDGQRPAVPCRSAVSGKHLFVWRPYVQPVDRGGMSTVLVGLSDELGRQWWIQPPAVRAVRIIKDTAVVLMEGGVEIATTRDDASDLVAQINDLAGLTTGDAEN